MDQVKNSVGIAVIGYGQVGRAFAKRIEDSGVAVVRIDPACPGLTVDGKEVLPSLPTDLVGIEIILACVPSAASLAVAKDAASRKGQFVLADLSSSSQSLMRECAVLFGAGNSSFCDGAIMGSVEAAGADAPITLAGDTADFVSSHLTGLGFRTTVLPNSKAGDASGLKLLRSLLTKSLEAVAIECYATARAMGLEQEIRANLVDIGARAFPSVLDSMIKTHVVHAPRRRQEIEAAIAQAEEAGIEVPMSRAALTTFTKTRDRIASEHPQSPPDVGWALEWLSMGYSS